MQALLRRRRRLPRLRIRLVRSAPTLALTLTLTPTLGRLIPSHQLPRLRLQLVQLLIRTVLLRDRFKIRLEIRF